MRKRILSLFVIITMIAGLIVPAVSFAASDDILTNYNSNTGELNITLPSAPEKDAWLVAASYNEQGGLEDLQSLILEAGADTTQTIKHLTPSETYKVFLWEKDTITPMSLPNGGSSKSQYTDLVTAKSTVYVPQIDGAVAHATAMAVDAYVEADAAKENTLSLFENTSSPYTTEDNTTGYINQLARIAEEGSDYEKREAIDKIETAMGAMEQALGAAAVLDAAAEKDIKQTSASISSDVVELMSSSSKKDEAVKWAQEIEAKWDSLPKKDKLRNLAEMMGVDARTAYKALSDAHDILSGKYTDDANFYDICTRVAIGVKTGAKVGVYVCATIGTAGAASAVGGLTVMQATGMVVGGVDCAVNMERSAAQIILGDDHKVVQAVENSTTMKVYDTAMFLFGAATYDPKTMAAGEKLLFIEDLVEKNMNTYENVKVLMDEATGLVVDRIEGETKKIAVEYTRIQSENKSDLAPAAQAVLGAENTGIINLDPSLNNGTANEQKEDFTSSMNSDNLSLKKTYALVKDGSKTLDEKISDFKASCDTQVTYKQAKKTSSGGGSGGGGDTGGGDTGGGDTGGGDTGGGGTGGGGTGGGDTGGFNLPDPSMDYDTVETEPYGDTTSFDKYYKDGNLVGEVTYTIDENGRYWMTEERWLCDNGDWVVTTYYLKGSYYSFDWMEGLSWGGSKRITAEKNGAVARRYGVHVLPNGYNYVWYDDVRYYPNGQMAEWNKRLEGKEIASYTYSPEGRLYEYETNWNDEYGFFNNSYTYYVYPAEAPFNPTGHIMEIFSSPNRTTYSIGSRSGEGSDERTYWGYWIYHGDNNGTDYSNPGWQGVTSQ